MDIYNNFSKVYDIFMENDNHKWVDFILETFKTHQKSPHLILDLGCGTGKITDILSNHHFDMIGVDISDDMLLMAKENTNKNILYLNQDMREFELYGTVDVILCLSDGLNYLLDPEDLEKVFLLCKNYLNPNGLLIFDLNTKYKFEKVLGDNNFSDIVDNAAYIWENYYDETDCINEYVLTLFIEDDKRGHYHRFEEIHYQKSHDIGEVSQLLNTKGFKIHGIFDDYEQKEISAKTQRAVFVCEKIE